MAWLLLVLAGCFGLVVGSFLNVVVWRLPRGESVVTPRSRCPGCGAPIAWFDNVPVLSWLLLGARCRGCRTRISPRYPLVEAATGSLFVLAFAAFPAHLPTAALVAVALAALLAVSLIDWDHKIIPDRITKPGIALAVLLAPATVLHPAGWIAGLEPALNAWLHAGAGAVAGAFVIYAVRVLGRLAFRKEAMGLGDAKLLAFLGALVGPRDVLYTLILACIVGAVFGLLRLAWARRRPLRFSLVIRGAGFEEDREAARIVEGGLVLAGPAPADVGTSVRVTMRLPAAGILEDEDAEIAVRGRVAPADDGWRVEITRVSDEDRERLEFFAASLRYVPFGPFLALGGVATLLLGSQVHWLVTEGYPGLFTR